LITADLTAAAAFFGVTTVISAVRGPGALTVGTPSNAAATTALAASQAAVESGIIAADAGMAAIGVPDIVASAGNLAGLTAARGFIARAAINLANAGS
jgi:hypothetical protein